MMPTCLKPLKMKRIDLLAIGVGRHGRLTAKFLLLQNRNMAIINTVSWTLLRPEYIRSIVAKGNGHMVPVDFLLKPLDLKHIAERADA